MKAHGTWQQTGGGGGGVDLSGLIQVAVIVGVAAGIALVIAEFAWLVISLGVVAAAVRLYILYRRTVVMAAIAAQGVLIREEQRERAAAALADQRRHEIEVAQASRPVIAPVIQIGADLLAAAAVAGAQQQQSWQQPQPVPLRVLPGTAEEVSRGR